ncbi:pyruvate dehydrogenase complex dihydrolipoamide acetyltransferase [Microbacterium sp. NPDC057407]|uniref:pyruvate dehydrogenase complex dihydrolipoamide acetyltransferase n=1 Tax=Microbacterium sp. NPDC057407 TaxID=3346120 RepID=UPI00366EE41A
MAAVVRMPALAAGASEAAIQSWLVEVGAEVSAGEAIVEIETEKAVVEYEAEEAGTLAGILVAEGEAAAVGAPIAVLAAPGQSAEDALAEAGAAPTAAESPGTAASAPADQAAPPEPPVSVGAPPARAGESAVDRPVSVVSKPAEPPAAETATPARPERAAPAADAESAAGASPAAASSSSRRLFASPLVRRLAKERGIDLATIQGSGPQGRIVRRDLDALPAAAPPAAAPAPAPARPGATEATTTPESVGYVDIPHTGMRRAIARRLTESTTTVPHFFLTADCRVDELLELRARINADPAHRVSVNDFVLKAVGAAMQEVPDANAIWTDAATRRFSSVDVAVAVAVPGGLLTPVVRGVERLRLGELSATVRALAQRARDGGLKQHELEGGSFSVSNLGMYGTTEFSAIINPPHSGILAVGAATPRPVVGADGALTVATVMTVTLSADHRVLDGAVAAQWLAAFVRHIENPLGMLV